MNFKEYTFLKEQSESHGLTPDIEDYINTKISQIEDRVKKISEFGKYNVIPSGDGLLDIINIDTHAVDGKLSYDGDLISSPVVHGDKVSFAVQKGGLLEDRHEVLGLIYELPNGQNVGSFRVEQEDPGRKYRTVIGTEETKEPEAEDEPLDKNIDDDEKETDQVPSQQKDADEDGIEDFKQSTEQQLAALRKEIEIQKQEEKEKQAAAAAASSPIPPPEPPTPAPSVHPRV